MQRGQIVLSKAGKEKGSFSVVLKLEGKYLSLADGKLRTLEKPKKKSVKHIQLTNSFLEENELETNKKIRKALQKFENASIIGGRYV